MQAVILAAGRGTRMGELTETTPKSMLEIAGKPLLEYKLEELPDEVDEVILIVGYFGSVIHNYFGGMFGDKRILYVEQENPVGGTADALWSAKDILNGRFLVLMGDDLYDKEEIEKCLRADGWIELVQHRDEIRQKGKVVVDKKANITDIEEGDHGTESGFLGTNLFVLDDRIFSCEMVPKAEGSKEYGLPQTVLAASKTLGVPFRAVEGKRWFEVTAPDDLKKAEAFLDKEN